MIKYITLALIACVIFQVPVPYAPEILASVVALFSLLFYHLVFRLLSGLNSASLNVESKEAVQATLLSTLTNGVAVAAVFMQTPYSWVALLAMPWTYVTLMTTGMTVLIYFGIIQIQSVDDE